MMFTTKDRDNDEAASNYNCATKYKSGLWYKTCFSSNLNGEYRTASYIGVFGINWYRWKNDWRSMKKVEMKTRPTAF
jgi:hypothetical protein